MGYEHIGPFGNDQGASYCAECGNFINQPCLSNQWPQHRLIEEIARANDIISRQFAKIAKLDDELTAAKTEIRLLRTQTEQKK